MKQKTVKKKLKERGYRIRELSDGFEVHDDYGWRAFVSETIRYGLNTCSLELPKEDYDVLNRYVRTPLEKR